MRLEDLQLGDVVEGLVPDVPAKVEGLTWPGPEHLLVTFEDAFGVVGRRLLTRRDEPGLTRAGAQGAGARGPAARAPGPRALGPSAPEEGMRRLARPA